MIFKRYVFEDFILPIIISCKRVLGMKQLFQEMLLHSKYLYTVRILLRFTMYTMYNML